jgi:hypothetical protein
MRAHLSLEDVGLLGRTLPFGRAQSAVAQGQIELSRALYTLATADYRAAFFYLRLFLELSLGAVAFSADLVQLEQWLSETTDLNWSALMDASSGVFSKLFIRAFSDGLEADAENYREMSKKVYRECSEYVHANPGTHAPTASAIAHNPSLDATWHDHCNTCVFLITLACAIRYYNEMTGPQVAALEPIFQRELGHLTAIHGLFSRRNVSNG